MTKININLFMLCKYALFLVGMLFFFLSFSYQFMQPVLDFYQALWRVGLRGPSSVPSGSPRELGTELLMAEWACVRYPTLSRVRVQPAVGRQRVMHLGEVPLKNLKNVCK